MNKNRTSDYYNTWVLINKKNEVIFSSKNVKDVLKKGKEFNIGEVKIEKKLDPKSCYFY